MSHLVTIKTEIREVGAVRAACSRLKLAEPVQGKHEVFGAECEGLAVRLPDWIYPVVCDTATGQVHYDNFGGRWGDEAHLNRFKQAYAVERTKAEARKQGRLVTETAMPSGKIKLTISLEGAA